MRTKVTYIYSLYNISKPPTPKPPTKNIHTPKNTHQGILMPLSVSVISFVGPHKTVYTLYIYIYIWIYNIAKDRWAKYKHLESREFVIDPNFTG